MLKSFMILLALAAIGGAVVLGFTQSAEVRGDTAVLDAGPETVVGEPVLRADGVPEPLEPAHAEVEDWWAYLFGLEAEDYATYTDAVQGFSFSYPKEFELLPVAWEDEEGIDLHHPTLPLGIRVSVHPFDPHSELVADLAAIPEEYELEAPEGALSWAVGKGGTVMRPLVRAEAPEGIRGLWWGLRSWEDRPGIGWTMRVRRGIAVPAIASAAAGQIQSFRREGRETWLKGRNGPGREARGLSAVGNGRRAVPHVMRSE